MTPKFHTLQIADVRTETEDTVSIAFEVPSSLKDDYKFISGQYLTLKTNINGEEIRRSYSLCSAPYENEWRVAIKKVEKGVFSNYAVNELKEGDTLEVMTPTGNFKVIPDQNSTRTYALFAGGSGITPILSITKTILQEEPNSDIILFYGNKNFSSIIFREEIEALKNLYMNRFRVIHVFSRESVGNIIQKGRVDKQKCDDLYKAFLTHDKIDDVYVCGPEGMILGVKESMAENGIDPKNIHFELFTTNVVRKPEDITVSNEPKIASNVSVILDGDTIELNLDSDGDAILDAALKAGADLPFACKDRKSVV